MFNMIDFHEKTSFIIVVVVVVVVKSQLGPYSTTIAFKYDETQNQCNRMYAYNRFVSCIVRCEKIIPTIECAVYIRSYEKAEKTERNRKIKAKIANCPVSNHLISIGDTSIFTNVMIQLELIVAISYFAQLIRIFAYLFYFILFSIYLFSILHTLSSRLKRTN